MKKIIFSAAFGLTIALAITGCYNDKYDQLYPAPTTPVTCDTSGTISFATTIMPIINANCNIAGGCHDAAGASTSGYNFTTYDGIKRQATNGNLVNDINWHGLNNMPKSGSKIAACDIDKITAWVDQGIQNN